MGVRSPYSTMAIRLWIKFQRRPAPPVPTEEDNPPLLYARVNHGRWIADCPVSECNNAHIVSKEERLFLCNACGEGRWYIVGFPPEAKEIEALLVARAEINQNLDVGETIDDLDRENAAHLAELQSEHILHEVR